MKTKEQLAAEYTQRKGDQGQPVTVTRIDLSFGNVFVLALKFGIVWLALGVVGAVIVLAIT